jgi:ribosomal-protein-alanine N-acetyltransferase
VIEIRRADASHLGPLHALAEESLDDPWSADAFRDELRHPAARVYLASEGGSPVGYLALRIVLDKIHVHSLAVRGRARRRGIARALLKDARREHSAARAWLLEVREDNGGARAFYGRLGFAEVGRRRGYYRDGSAAVLMTRNPAASPL